MPLARLQERVADATGVGLNTVRRIIKEGESKPGSSKFTSPRKTIAKASPKSTFDEFEEEIIRKVVCTFISIHKCRPTIDKILEAVKADGIAFTGKRSTFSNVLRKLGFRWRRTEDNRRLLVEKSEIRAKRVEFLRKLKKYKEEGRNIVYCDETYLTVVILYQNHETMELTLV